MTKVLSLRVADDLADWATAYAEERGVTRQALLEEGLRSFKEDCERGVPEIRAVARRQSAVKDSGQGVGQCPERGEGLGHVWQAPRADPFRSCEFCGLHGRESAVGTDPKVNGRNEGGGYLQQATAERADFFSGLDFPDSANGKARAT